MAPTREFRVDRDPILTVGDAEGGVHAVGLRELFLRAHEWTGLTGLTPPGQVAWHRLLTAIAYRVTGLDTHVGVDSWRESRNGAWVAGAFDPQRVADYFDRWHDRWDLFDRERPWMQVAALANECEVKPVAELFATRPSGENSETLFSPFHSGVGGSRAAAIAAVVEAMLVTYGFSAGGRMGSRRLHGMTAPKASGFGGPLRARVQYLPLAANLFETLMASLVPPTTLRFAESAVGDSAAWELAEEPDPHGVCPRPSGVLSLLTGQSQRAVLLRPNASNSNEVAEVWSSWRFLTKSPPSPDFDDPFMALHSVPQKGTDSPAWTPRYAPTSGGLPTAWRDLPAILPVAGRRLDRGYLPPAVVNEASWLPGSDKTSLRVQVFQWSQEPRDARDHEWLMSTTPDIHAALWSEDAEANHWRVGIATWVESATKEGDVLWQALFDARVAANRLDPEKKEADKKLAEQWPRRALPWFWARAEAAFEAAFGLDPATETSRSGATFEEQSSQAQVLLREVAIGCYDQVTAGPMTSQGLVAVAQHRPRSLTRRDTETVQPAAPEGKPA